MNDTFQVGHAGWSPDYNSNNPNRTLDAETADAGGIRRSALFGIISIRNRTPEDGQCVVWMWASAGQITAGDYYNGQCRDAAANYAVTDTVPTHWMPWPNNWPNTEAIHHH